MAARSSILAQKIQWTEGLSGYSSQSHRVWHDWAQHGGRRLSQAETSMGNLMVFLNSACLKKTQDLFSQSYSFPGIFCLSKFSSLFTHAFIHSPMHALKKYWLFKNCESLCCTPETYIAHQLYLNKKKNIKTDWLTAKREPLYKVLGTKMIKIDPGPTGTEFMVRWDRQTI